MLRTTLILSFFLSLFSFQNDTGNLTVHIEGIENSNGTIKIAIYNQGGKFLKIGTEFKKTSINSSLPSASYTFKNIPFDVYAVATYHDENNDSKCNTNLLGVPTEAYGFSNNVKPFLSAPSFGKAQFEFNKTSSIHITLRY